MSNAFRYSTRRRRDHALKKGWYGVKAQKPSSMDPFCQDMWDQAQIALEQRPVNLSVSLTFIRRYCVHAGFPTVDASL